MGFLGGLVALVASLLLVVLIGYFWEVRSERREWERIRHAAREAAHRVDLEPIGEFLQISDQENEEDRNRKETGDGS